MEKELKKELKKELSGGEKDLMVEILECGEGNNDGDYAKNDDYNKFLDDLYEILDL